MGHVTAIGNQKGGVGKTSTTFNLGFNLAAQGKKVLIIDNDPQSNLTNTFSKVKEDNPEEILCLNAEGQMTPGISNTYHLYTNNGIDVVPYVISENIHLVGASKHLSNIGTDALNEVFEFKENVDKFRDAYDFILIDCLPSFGTLQAAAHGVANTLFIPTELEDYSCNGITEQIDSAMQVKKRYNPQLSILGVFSNKCANPMTNLQKLYLERIKESIADLLFDTQINHTTKMGESLALGVSISEYLPKSKIALQYQSLTNEFLAKVEALS